ncbi:hypothetical protein GCM10008955_22080 [Deinococcus malanensis]|uniref:ArsR family transcriptional regulator n=1 Tax=Deinococcus malanensis TaxID=1706855 RepID=A0ABQ2EY49_9DEIO|nr:hypothetical protein [Deinococcus malanensis]GGK27892.1 hypothetical protein GCM10008955_22080 [Deinococcus malanensis]
MPDISTFVLQSEAQLLALLDVRYGGHLLGQFRGGATASEAARRLGEPAPRVAYHVGHLRRLGLLVPAPGPGRGQPLQPVAERYVVPEHLLTLLEAHTTRPVLTALCEAFLTAQGQQVPPAKDFTLLDLSAGPRDVDLSTFAPASARLLVRVTRLTPAAFERMVNAAWDAIAHEEQAAPETRGARLFTLSLMGFAGSMLPLSEAQESKGE